MILFKRIVFMEFKRLIKTWRVFLLIVLMVVCLGFVRSGAGEYKKMTDEKDRFDTFEDAKVSQYVTYTQYGGYGIRILFIPHQLSVLFTNIGGVPDILAYMDSGERLKVYNSLKGRDLFRMRIKQLGPTDFSGVLLFLGSLLSIFYGLETLRNREYLKQFSSIHSPGKLYTLLYTARTSLIVCLTTALFGTALLVSWMSGVPLFMSVQMLVYFFTVLITLLFFYSLGLVFGTLKSAAAGVSAALGLWLLLMFFIPIATDLYIAARANTIKPLLTMEMDKLKVIMSFEKRVIENEVTYKYGEKLTEKVKESVQSYYANEFEKINRMEEEMREKMLTNIRHYHIVSMIFPSSFFRSMAEEAGSRGMLNIAEFYKYAQGEKRKFFKFYMDKLYFSGESNFAQIENYVKNEENLFYAESRLPEGYGLGFLLTFLYTCCIFIFSYHRYKKHLYRLPRRWEKGAENPRVNISKGINVFHVPDSRFSRQLYAMLSGDNRVFNVPGFKEKIFIDGKDLAAQTGTMDFLYITRLHEVPPDITAGDFLRLALQSKLKEIPDYAAVPLGELDEGHIEDIYIKILSTVQREIYLIDDIGKNMDHRFVIRLKVLMAELAESGASVIYLTSDYSPPIRDMTRGGTFYKHNDWLKLVANIEKLEEKNISAPDD